MPKTIRIRNVPDDLRKKLKVRAAERGLEQPTLQETLKHLGKLPPVYLDEDPAETIRRHRDA